jgi:hypothetical protein
MQRISWFIGQGQVEVLAGKIDYRFWYVLQVAARKIYEQGQPVFDSPLLDYLDDGHGVERHPRAKRKWRLVDFRQRSG